MIVCVARQHPGFAGHDVLFTFFVFEHVMICVRSLIEASGDADGTGIFLLLTGGCQGKQNGYHHGKGKQYFPVHGNLLGFMFSCEVYHGAPVVH